MTVVGPFVDMILQCNLQHERTDGQELTILFTLITIEPPSVGHGGPSNVPPVAIRLPKIR